MRKDDAIGKLSATLEAPPSGGASPSGSEPGATRFVAGALVGGRYELVEQLGRGAHGAVFRANDRHADTQVALKILTDLRDDYLALLRRELSAARRITHRGVVRMFDLVEIDGGWALSMELVEGRSLDAEIAEGRASPVRLARLAELLAEALAAAHDAGVVHRDLKPQNILVRADGAPVITDFGVSRVTGSALATTAGPTRSTGADVKLTVEGSLLGTPLYMAPEQLDGQTAVGPAVDVYAYGLILFEAATGLIPHDAETLGELHARRLTEAAPSLAAERPDLPPELCAVIQRCLATDPLERFSDGGAISVMLHPPSPRARAERRSLRLWPLGALVSVVGLGVAAWAALRQPAIPQVQSAAPPPSSSESSSAPPMNLALTNARRVTFGPLCEEYPTFFPDGTRLVFDLTEGVKSHLVELDLETGTQKRLTTSPLWDFGATVSPDGTQVVFMRMSGKATVAALLDVATGAVKELEPTELRPTFSTDGRAVWLGPRAKARRIDVATGNVTRELTAPDHTTVSRVLDLDQDRMIGLLRSGVDLTQGEVGVFDARSGEWTRSGPTSYTDVLTRAPDGRRFFFTSTESRLGVWAGAFSDMPRPAALSRLRTGFDISRDGKRAAWSTCGGALSLVAIEDGRFRPIIEGTKEWSDPDATYLEDGRMVQLSDRQEDTSALWITPPTGGPASPLSLGGVIIRELSSQGTRVVAATNEGLRLLDLAKVGAPVVLTASGEDRGPTFDRNGDVVFYRTDETMYRVSRSGGEARRIDAEGHAPTASSHEDLLVFVAKDERSLLASGARGVHPFGQGLPSGTYFQPEFSPDGTKLAVILDKTQLLVLNVKTQRVERTIKLERGSLVRPVFTPGGVLHAVGADWIGDVWVAELE